MTAASHQQLVALLSADPASTVLLCDFDGTLSPIVADPAAARPAAGAGAALSALAARYRRVAVVSGRPLTFLEPLLPVDIDIAALYGLERRVGGDRWEHPDAPMWRRVVAEVADLARLAFEGSGVEVEPKGQSLTLHVRHAPALADRVARWADVEANRTGLVARAAKASVELHPALAIDKGTVVREWSAGAGVVAFCGDDLGDLAAFRAIHDLGAGGLVRTVRLAVGGEGAPVALLRDADVVFDGPAEFVELLQQLAAVP